jgi:hypothetical protein
VVYFAPLAAARGQLFLWVGILLGCFLVGGAAIYGVRRYVRGGRGPSSGAGLTLDQVRQMRQRGEISQREYEALRRRVVSQSTLSRDGGPLAV